MAGSVLKKSNSMTLVGSMIGSDKNGNQYGKCCRTCDRKFFMLADYFKNKDKMNEKQNEL